MAQYGNILALAFAASLLITFAVRAVARRFAFVAKPRADRWHKKPTALFGGIGIFGAFAISSVILPPESAPGQTLLLVCSAGMFVVGLIDDFIQLKPYTKLVAQILLATTFTMFGMRLHWLPSEVLDQALTIFWLVGITNALNLLDNLDGLAGGIAAIAAAYLVYFCHQSAQTGAAQLTSALVGALAGFLVFNFNPASIFMGDCGSLFLGFFLGGVTLVNNQPGLRRNVITILTLPVLLLLLPIVDTTLVTFTRKLNGRSVSQGGRDHTSHRLVALGLSERAAALTLWVLAAISGAVAVGVSAMSGTLASLIVPTFGIVVVFLAVFLGRVKVYAPIANEAEGGGRAILPTLADFTYKRRVFEVLHDLALVVLSYYAAFLLRFDGELVQPYYQEFVSSLPLIIVAQLGSFLALGLYRGLWRYTSMADLPMLVRSTLGAWVASVLLVFFILRPQAYSRGVFIIDGLLLLFGVFGSRIAFRLLRVWLARLQPPPNARRVLIYGAGDGGELLLREIQNNRELGLLPVGFVDDDPNKQGRVIHGVRVLGPLARLSELQGNAHADEMICSTSKLNSERSLALTATCQSVGIPLKRMRIALE